MTIEELQRLHAKLALIHPAECGLRAGQSAELVRELIEHRTAMEDCERALRFSPGASKHSAEIEASQRAIIESAPERPTL